MEYTKGYVDGIHGNKPVMEHIDTAVPYAVRHYVEGYVNGLLARAGLFPS